jgi:hypothetical protein
MKPLSFTQSTVLKNLSVKLYMLTTNLLPCRRELNDLLITFQRLLWKTSSMV